MKKLCTLLMAVLMVLSLCACDEMDKVKDAAQEVQGTVSKYGQQIEDSKKAIEDGIEKMQGVLDEVKEKLPAD